MARKLTGLDQLDAEAGYDFPLAVTLPRTNNVPQSKYDHSSKDTSGIPQFEQSAQFWAGYGSSPLAYRGVKLS